MKKFLAVLLLSLFWVTSSFAALSQLDVIVKAGISPYSSLDYNGNYAITSDNPPTTRSLVGNYLRTGDEGTDIGISLAAEGFAYLGSIQFLGLGFGVSEFFSRKTQDMGEVSFTNIYAVSKLRYSLLPNNAYDDENPLFLYLVGHFGLSLMDHEFKFIIPARDASNATFTTNNKFYYGVGVGVETRSIIVEILFSRNSATIESDSDFITADDTKYHISGQEDRTYSAITFNVGYRFNLFSAPLANPTTTRRASANPNARAAAPTPAPQPTPEPVSEPTPVIDYAALSAANNTPQNVVPDYIGLRSGSKLTGNSDGSGNYQMTGESNEGIDFIAVIKKNSVDVTPDDVTWTVKTVPENIARFQNQSSTMRNKLLLNGQTGRAIITIESQGVNNSFTINIVK